MNDPSETISTNCTHKIISGVQKKRRKKVENNNYFGLLRTSEKLCAVGTFWAISWHESLNCSLFRDKKTRYLSFLLGAVNFGFEMREDFVFTV